MRWAEDCIAVDWGTTSRRAYLLDGEADLIVMGRPELTALYAAALAEAGHQTRAVNAETAVIEGIKRIAERIE